MTEIHPMLSGNTDKELVATPAFTYADLIVDYLGQIEVEYVFGIPGGAIEALFDALSRRGKGEIPHSPIHFQRANERKHSRSAPGPRVVVARHEAGAAFMADGYARSTGKLGVCCSTTGPGATNLITGVANAYVDRVPMLVITPQTALPSFGQRGFQESSSDLVDVVSMFDHCTRYSSLVSHPEQLEGKLFTALSTAFRRPRGPVHLSIPADILSLPVPNAAARFNVATLLREPVAVDDASYHALLNAVEATRVKGRGITIFIGEDCGEAAAEILQFADLVEANIVTSPAGKRWIGAGHPRYYGVFGFAGHDSARRVLTDDSVELVLAVGTSFNELDTAGWDTQALLNDRLVHVASSVASFDRSPMAYLHVYGNLRALFGQLVTGLDAKYIAYRNYSANGYDSRNNYTGPDRRSGPTLKGEAGSGANPIENNYANGYQNNGHHSSNGYGQNGRSQDGRDLNSQSKNTPAQDMIEALIPPAIDTCDAEKLLSDELPIKPQRLMNELVKKFPSNSRFFVDTGNAWSWATHYMHLKSPDAFFIAMGFGAMGWAIGAAIGASFGSRRAPSVCITGDGAYLMSGQEITVAMEHHLPVIYVVLNDRALGMVKHGQRMSQAEQIGANLPAVDFAAMAKAQGVKAFSVQCWEDFADIDPSEFSNMEGPVLLDVLIDGEEIPPMKSRLDVLQDAKHGVDLSRLKTLS